MIPIHVRLTIPQIERRLEEGRPVRKKCFMCARWMIHNRHSQVCNICTKKLERKR